MNALHARLPKGAILRSLTACVTSLLNSEPLNRLRYRLLQPSLFEAQSAKYAVLRTKVCKRWE